VTALLLDTNVLSELRKPSPNANVTAYIAAQSLESLFVSDVTFAEIRFGIEQATDPLRRAALHEWLQGPAGSTPLQSVADAGASSHSAAVARRVKLRALAQSETW
jgi:predicted nucleic acid-binding protein